MIEAYMIIFDLTFEDELTRTNIVLFYEHLMYTKDPENKYCRKIMNDYLIIMCFNSENTDEYLKEISDKLYDGTDLTKKVFDQNNIFGRDTRLYEFYYDSKKFLTNCSKIRFAFMTTVYRAQPKYGPRI